MLINFRIWERAGQGLGDCAPWPQRKTATATYEDVHSFVLLLRRATVCLIHSKTLLCQNHFQTFLLSRCQHSSR